MADFDVSGVVTRKGEGLMIEYIYKNKTPYLLLWVSFFLYTTVVAVLVQIVLLPYIFPAWHAGNGLLVGGDWLSFHNIAVELSSEIKTIGWSAWELRPKGQAPAGIAAVIYTLTVPKPWTLIPFNAILHASATLVLFKIIQSYINRWQTAVLCVLPFLLFPSAMTWYTQIHKDGLFILGCLCFLYGLIKLVRDPKLEFNIEQAIKSIIITVFGMVLVWIVRPYGTQMLLGTTVCSTVLISIVIFSKLRRGQIDAHNAVAIVASYLVVIIIVGPFAGSGLAIEVSNITSEKPVIEQEHNVTQMNKHQDNEQQESSSSISIWSGKVSSTVAGIVSSPLNYMNSIAYSIGLVRDGFRFGYPEAGSNIDCDVGLYDVKDIVCYIPRALEISFLAPFPNQWFAQGTMAANTAMRKVSALEMSITYIFLAFLPFFIWRWRKRIEVWIILIVCSGMMLGFTLVIPNIGTLYRDRYAFIMTIVSMGIAGGIIAWKQYKTR